MMKETSAKHPAPQDAVAVVGMGLNLPGASTTEEFWEAILEQRRFFQPATVADWGADPKHFYQPGNPAPDKAYSLTGAFNPQQSIDPNEFNLPEDFDPKSADGSLAYWLTAGQRAAGQVNWGPLDLSRVGVICGHVILPTKAMAEATVSLYTKEATREWDTSPKLDPAPKDAFRQIGYSARILARVLGFEGPAYTVDAACASSLYAVHLAMEALISGELEAVISGGVAKADALFTQMGFSQLRALSPTGLLNPFEARADGMVVGEGAVALVLKRLDTALAHGDHIRAVVRGVGLSNDQTGNLLAPQAEGQLRAMRAAWNQAGLNPRVVGLIEAHSTGTILGDQVEVASIKELLSSAKGDKKYPAPVIGSIKSNIGHLLSAAGAASLAKVILALENKILPPTAGFEKEAEGLNLGAEPTLRVLSRPEAWPSPPGNGPRVAAVNGFGFGGVNAQVIVEEFVPQLWAEKKGKVPRAGVTPRSVGVRLLSARALAAPWPDFASLAQNWMESEGPPIISTRRFESLRATGLFFNSLTLEGSTYRLAPTDLAQILPQQALALKLADEIMTQARLSAAPNQSHITSSCASAETEGVDKTRVGVFMGVDIDPRAADYAYRWLSPLRAAEALVTTGELAEKDVAEFVAALRRRCHPALTASRVLGTLGSLVASRVARYLGLGGPCFTVSEAQVSGVRALKLAMAAIERGEIDLALVGAVDTMGDPKMAALDPKKLWEEGAAMMILASDEAAAALGRSQAPELTRLPGVEGRPGSLGGLFTLIKHAFFISHHLASRGPGAGAAYWIKNRIDPPRRLESVGFVITEKGGEEVSSPPYSYEDATWFLVRSRNENDARELLNHLDAMAREASEDNNLMEVLGPVRAEKRALKRLGDRFWAQFGDLPGARPTLAMMARGFDDLHNLIKKARAYLNGDTKAVGPEYKGRIVWALKAERIQGELAWVFPGSGSHYHGMGRRLARCFPQIMEELNRGVSRLADHFQSYLFWSPTPREIRCYQAILAQVSFGLLGAKVLQQFKVLPQAVLGYSLGETTALVATGAWPDRETLYEDLVRSPLFTRQLAGDFEVARRCFNWPEHKAFRWTTGIVPRSAQEIRKALERLPEIHKGRVFLLLINTPGEGVVGGEESAVRALTQILGNTIFPLEGVASVHNHLVAEVAASYERFHTRPTTLVPGLRYYSAAWAQAYEPNRQTAARSLTEQAINGHDFPRLIEQAYADGVRFFVEIGAGSGVSRLINDILGERPHLASSLATNVPEEGWLGLHRLLVELWMAGYPMKMSMLYPDAAEAIMSLPIPIILAPTKRAWPQPDQVLKEDQAEPEPNVASSLAGSPKLKTTRPSWLPAPPVKPAASPAPQGSLKTNISPLAELSSSGELSRAVTETKTRPPENKTRPLQGEKVPPAPLFSREKCLEFAVGRVAGVFGDSFAEVDTFPSRVRLPDEPLMLVDRVLSLEGQAQSLGSGRIVTEHDIHQKAWYLDNGCIPAGLAIESGQADLMLSAWLGVDSATRGLTLYRLLDAEVTFHRSLPRTGETVRYDIRIIRFFKYGQTRLFRFEFEATINGQPLLSMKNGCAGFFSQAELDGGRGLPGGGLSDEISPARVNLLALRFRSTLPSTLSEEALENLRAGRLSQALGANFTPKLTNPLKLPGGRLNLIHRITRMEKNGGRYGAGFIRAEADIDPQAWFLTSHFVGDEVMPGTLMYESCLQALRVFLTASGWVGEEGQTSWQPLPGLAASLKCRGQVTAQTKVVAYEVHLRRLDFQLNFQLNSTGELAEPVAEAEAIMLADDRPIVEVRNLNLRLAGSSLDNLKAIWSQSLAPEADLAPAEAQPSLVFHKEKLLALAQGRPSLALGSGYARFDDGDFVARLPRPPYDLVDKVTVTCGQLYEVREGSEVKAEVTVPATSWLFSQAGGVLPDLPYAALNEIALQPCGFLAAFMGSALLFDSPRHFRNLGGQATVLKPVLPGNLVETRARLTKNSRMGDMLIQHYQFTCQVAGETVYEGVTHFGFFTPEALMHQAGLTGESPESWPGRPAVLTPYPQGTQWPQGPWRMIDNLALNLAGGPAGLGTVFAQTKVDPQAWFFKAHFYQDPVWPGSLGLEAFVQALKALVAARFDPGDQQNWFWVAPGLDQIHQWLYRGQITPEQGEMTIALVARQVDETLRCLTADGILLVDGKPIYKISGLSVGQQLTSEAGTTLFPLTKTKARAKTKMVPVVTEKAITASEFMAFRKDRSLSQGQMAKLMGVTPIYISLMERGKRNISPLMLEKITEIFANPPAPSDQVPESLPIPVQGVTTCRKEARKMAEQLLTPEKLRELRLGKGMSQKKLADQVGVTATLIGLIELGKRSLSLNLAQKILAVFGEG